MTQHQVSTKNLKSESINREIIRLAVPSIVSNVTIPLLGLCDTAISGHLGSASFLAAIAVSSMMLNTIFWIFGFLRMGTTGMIAIAYGAKNDHDMRAVSSRAFVLAALSGFLLIALSKFISIALVSFINPPVEVAVLARTYFRICIWEAPALLMTMVISGWFIGSQSTFWPMVIAIFTNVANILFSLIAVFGLKFGFRGIALGTVCANWTGFVLAVFLVWKNVGHISKLWCGFETLLRFKDMGRFFKVNSNLFVRSACIIAVSLGVTALGAREGVILLAVNTTMMQFFNFYSFFMDGFAFAGEALIGRFTGEKDKVRFNESVSSLLAWSFLIALLFTFIYRFGSDYIAALLTDDIEVNAGFADFGFWVVVIPLSSCLAFIFDGFYVGLTATKDMLVSTLLGAIAFLVITCVLPDYFPSRETLNNNFIWFGFVAYLFIRGVYLSSRWKFASDMAIIEKIKI